MRTALAPASSTARMVGSAARMRRSLVTLPFSSSGTLKSTRIRARLPCRSGSSASVFFAMRGLPETGRSLGLMAQSLGDRLPGVLDELVGTRAREGAESIPQCAVRILDQVKQVGLATMIPLL